jgi:phosphopantothenoylcysteine decarboxylase / phosphopantothenate---cysteine ligase
MPKRPRILITAGPTREMIDPVRFLSNVSTGVMGYELARAAKRRGLSATLVSGPTLLAPPRGVHFKQVITAAQMKRAILKCWPRTDVLIMTAAVCDYAPVRFSPNKIKRVQHRTIHFKRTEDILQAVGKRKGKRVLVGFALETENYVANAKRKLKRKHLDLIVLNWYGRGHDPFGTKRTSMILIDKQGNQKRLSRASKPQAANAILDAVL